MRKAIHERAGSPNLHQVKEVAKSEREAFEDCREDVVSLLTTALQDREDPFLAKLRDEVESSQTFGASEFINYHRPRGRFISYDSLALSQGIQVPPHMAVLAEVIGLLSPGHQCATLAKAAKRAASHLAKRQRYSRRAQEVGTNVFIGHGGSRVWRDLKDFVQNGLALT